MPARAFVHCVMPGQGHPAVLPGSASLIAAGLGGLGMHGDLARPARALAAFVALHNREICGRLPPP